LSLKDLRRVRAEENLRIKNNTFGLRIQWGNPWGFNSPPSHFS